MSKPYLLHQTFYLRPTLAQAPVYLMLNLYFIFLHKNRESSPKCTVITNPHGCLARMGKFYVIDRTLAEGGGLYGGTSRESNP